MGRYITADPIGLYGGINLYGYVDGDPVNWIDPQGLDRYKMCGGVLGTLFNQTCRKVVDFGCAGQRNIICCDSEKKECQSQCKEDSWGADMLDCEVKHAMCITRTKKPKKLPPEKPIPHPTTPQPKAPGIPKIEKWGEKPKIKHDDYLK